MEEERPPDAVSQCHTLPSVPSTPLKGEFNADSMSIDSNSRAASVMSVEDAEKLAAAAALSDLQAEVQSPPKQHLSLSHGSDRRLSANPTVGQNPEPLLDLLKSTHPIISTAINGPLAAYSSSKSYSPRFRSGAEFVERHIGSPVASTVGSVGRRTGVEGGVRWWLKRTDSKYGESEGSSNKRRRVSGIDQDGMDIEKGLSSPRVPAYRERRQSEVSLAESLPPYDDHRSPNYEELGTSVPTQQERGERQTTPNSNWHRRLILSTSGLGVAMSEESRKSLKYCLSWLRYASHHIRKVIRALEGVLEEWDQSSRQSAQRSTDSTGSGEPQPQPNLSNSAVAQRDERSIPQRVQALKGEILQILRDAVDIVSTYAGGALPENARTLVRRHLTSLPHRFHLASSSSALSSPQPTSQTAKSGHHAMVLAKEGIAMMANVSEVLDATLVSAEEWCERFGRRQRDEPDAQAETQTDVKERPGF
ncbi:MAG: hypothetical protein M1836_000562 [Candelina mexicana]|nr:MAG: hypothetical protein M1836_000562 [Candelina mexicana]